MTFSFGSGLIVGKFQPFHLGHCQLVKTALNTCKRVLILIWEPLERSQENPYTYDLCREMIEKVFPMEISQNRLFISSIPYSSEKSNKEICKYIIHTAAHLLGLPPDVIISAKQTNNNISWESENFTELIIPKYKNIRSKEVIRLMIEDKRGKWEQLMPMQLHPYYTHFRHRLMTVFNGLEIS